MGILIKIFTYTYLLCNSVMLPLSIVLLLLGACLASEDTPPIPIVLWHGMGDCCCNPLSMGSVVSYLEQAVPGAYVTSLMVGDNVVQDTENGFFLNINKQIDLVCQMVNNDEKLKNGYHAVGFSQGGLFMRGLAQRCPSPRIRNLVSIGGPQQGVYGLPKCLGENHTLCDYARRLLNYGAYIGWIQRLLVQAQYWHDPLAEQEYRDNSLFLADINNEGPEKNETFKENLAALDNLVLVQFTEDSIVDPKESEAFGWFSPEEDMAMVPVQNTTLYTEDWIGLKTLDQQGKLHFMSVKGDHLQLDRESLDEITDKYLK